MYTQLDKPNNKNSIKFPKIVTSIDNTCSQLALFFSNLRRIKCFFLIIEYLSPAVLWLVYNNKRIGYRIYVDILHGEIFSVSIREGDWVNGLDGGYRYLASCEHHFVRVRENVVQHPSNDISISQYTNQLKTNWHHVRL